MMGKNTLQRIGAGGLMGLLLLVSCAPAPTKNKAQLHIVEIKQMQFQPATLYLHNEDTVQFINHDMVAHNATEITKTLWASPTLASGDSWKVVVRQSADYYCSIHVVMKGKIVVQ